RLLVAGPDPSPAPRLRRIPCGPPSSRVPLASDAAHARRARPHSRAFGSPPASARGVAYPRVLRAGTLRLPARIRLDPVRTGRRGPRLSLAHQGLRGPLVRPDLAQGRSAIRPAAFRSPFPPHP